MPSRKCEIFESIGLAEEDVCSRTEHDFRYAVAFAWPKVGPSYFARADPDPWSSAAAFGLPGKIARVHGCLSLHSS